MKTEEIKLSDWARILFGNVPYSFYFEIAIHAFFVYALLMVSMRLMGTRMSAQVSRLDLAAMVALASAIGVPLLSPQNGLIPAVIIALIVVVINRIIARWSFKNEYVEQLTQGDVDVLIEDMVMQTRNMKKTRISRERLFAELRSEKMSHLGMVKRVYLEADGHFSIIKNEDVKPGLVVLPEWDTEFIQEKVKATDVMVCSNCGNHKPNNTPASEQTNCPNCGKSEWTNAVVER